MKNLTIRLEGSASNYLTRNKDNQLEFDFNPKQINVYKRVFNKLVPKYSIYNLSIDDLLGTSVIRGIDDKSQERLLSFINIKESYISSYQIGDNQILNVIV